MTDSRQIDRAADDKKVEMGGKELEGIGLDQLALRLKTISVFTRSLPSTR